MYYLSEISVELIIFRSILRLFNYTHKPELNNGYSQPYIPMAVNQSRWKIPSSLRGTLCHSHRVHSPLTILELLSAHPILTHPLSKTLINSSKVFIPQSKSASQVGHHPHWSKVRSASGVSPGVPKRSPEVH